jgi:hypothetical protein
MYPIYKGKRNQKTTEEFRFYRYVAEHFREAWLTVHHRALSVFQAGFIKWKQTTENIFVIKKTIDKYFRFKLGRLYW